jgi:hypothetical protein
MGDVSGGGALALFVGSLVTSIGFGTQLLKYMNERKREKAYASIGPTAPAMLPPPVTTSSSTVTPIDVLLQAKEVEILQLKYELIEAQEGCRRLRRAEDDRAVELAKMAAAVTTERGRANSLREEVDELRRQIMAAGERHEPRDRQLTGRAAGLLVRGAAGGVDTVRTQDRTAPRKPR